MEENNGKSRFGAGFIAGLCIGLTVAVMVGAGLTLRLRSYKDSTGVLDAATAQKVSLISGLIDKHFYNYNEEEVTLEDKRVGLYQGLMDSLDDRYADYYTAEELQEQMTENEGVYYGIGAYISVDLDLNYPYLTGIMEDTPAEKAGLRSGDVIVEIDGASAYGMDSSEAAELVRGEEGTSVHLTIFREGEDDYMGFDVVRGKVESRTVVSEMKEDDIGYIGIVEFDLTTVDQFTKAYREIRNSGAKGLVLDLRGNPGGLVYSVEQIARQILPEGLIYYTEDSSGNREEYACDGANEIDIPLVVLINGRSASASEILSGAIRDHGIGTLIGTKTYGKGIIQQTIRMSDGSAVKMTTGAYFSPNGINIQGTGIEPDVEVEFDADAYYDDGVDNQLNAAIAEIKKKMT